LKIEYYKDKNENKDESRRVGYKMINISDFIGKGL